MAFRPQFETLSTSFRVSGSSWVYLVYWVLSGVLAIAFIFYYSRLLAFLLTQLLRIVWDRFHFSLHMESIKFSFFGGRVFIKNLTVTHKDFTISVIKVNFTWRYWLISLPRLSGYYLSSEEEIKRNSRLPSIFTCTLEGFEWFIYNRSMAYDQIEEILNGQKFESDSSSQESREKSGDVIPDVYGNPGNPTVKSEEIPFGLKFLLRLVPLYLRIKKGTIVVGNASTPSILVMAYKSAGGYVDVNRTPNPADVYRFIEDLRFERFQVWFKPNVAYDKTQYSSESEQPEPPSGEPKLSNLKRYRGWFRYQNASDRLHKLYRRLLRRNEVHMEGATPAEWRGLSRYMGDGGENLMDLFDVDEEYAKYSLILDSVSTRIVYYYDVIEEGYAFDKTSPPKHALEVHLSLATIHYGPWADKQRVPLQSVFYPTLARDSVPTVRKKREYEGFQFVAVIEDELIFRVPTREPSKNKDLIKRVVKEQGKAKREEEEKIKVTRSFGWLELKVGEGSNISYYASFIASEEEGWANKLNAVFASPEVRTSVNHDILFLAEKHTIDANVGFPLKWNGPCDWLCNQKSDNSQVFFLREHTLLFSDIFEDFASGDPTPYEYFRPFLYRIRWSLDKYKIYLNVNDANIINNPLDFSVNRFISFQGDDLQVNLDIPLNGDFSRTTTISYELDTSFFNMVLDTPHWHTLKAFIKDSTVMGRSNRFKITGSYTFYSSIQVFTSNYIEIRCVGEYVTVKAYGQLIKYLFFIRENYFGDHIHFRTFEEYTNGAGDDATIASESHEEDPDYSKIIKTENDVDVLFSFEVLKGMIVIPYHLFGSSSHVGLSFNSFSTDIRFTNYYMDLQADFSCIRGAFVQDEPDEWSTIFDIPRYKERFLKDPTIRLDGLSIHAHRMFGLPPEELTYYCKWDLELGSFEIDGDVSVLVGISTSVINSTYGFMDVENSLNIPEPTEYDAVNVSFKCPIALVKIRLSEGMTLVCDLGSLLVTYNDISNSRYSSKLSASIPNIQVTLRGEETLLDVSTSLLFTNFCQKKDMVGHRKKQQAHIRRSDAPFHRAAFLIDEERRDNVYDDAYGCFLHPLTLPDVDAPLVGSEWSEINTTSSSKSEYSFSSNGSRWTNYPLRVYDDDEYCPAYTVDPDVEYDNMIVELGEVKAFVDAECVVHLAQMCLDAQDLSIEALMDSLQLHLVTGLKKKSVVSNETKNIRLVSPAIDLELKNDNDSFKVSLEEPSLAFSIKTWHQKELIQTSVTGAGHLMDLRVDFGGSELVSMHEVEAWVSKPHNDKLIVSSSVESTEIKANFERIKDAVNFGLSIEKAIGPGLDLVKKFAHQSHDRALGELVYALVVASTEYAIDHDPEVLTKPANILRSRNEHVRFFDGWKMLTRLRHVLNVLPQRWHARQNKRFRSGQWHVQTSEAQSVVTDFFSRWRNWESDPEQREWFHQTVFGGGEEKAESPFHLSFRVSSLSVHLERLQKSDFVRIANFCATAKKDGVDCDVFCGLASYRGKLSVISMDLICEVMNMLGRAERSVPPREASLSDESPTFNVVFSVNSFSQQGSLLYSSLDLSTSNLVVSVKNQRQGSSYFANCSLLDLSVWGDASKFFQVSIADLFVGSALCEIKILDVNVGSISVNLANKGDNMAALVDEVIKRDVEYLKKVEVFNIEPSKEAPSQESLPDFDINVKLQQFVFAVGVLQPLRVYGSIYGTQLEVANSHGKLSMDALVEKININGELAKMAILELQFSQLEPRLKASSDFKVVSGNCKLGYVKVFCPQMVNTIVVSNNSIETLKESVQSWENVLSVKKKPEKSSAMPDFSIHMSVDYIGISTFAEKTKVSLEIDNASCGMSNVDLANGGHQVDPFGDLNIPAARLYIIHRSIQVGLSNVIDFNLAIKILHMPNSLQALQVESQFCRVCLSPPVLRKVVEMIDLLDMKVSETESPSKPKPTTSILNRFSSSHLLAYNFCVGWVFEQTSREYPGVIMGAERFFAIAEESLGKFTLMGAYLSVANGARSSNFYSKQSEKSNLNRAFLPTMQLVYSLETESKKMNVVITGDELDVKFLSTSVAVIENGAKSMSEVEDFLSKRQQKEKKPPSSTVDKGDAYVSPYDTIELKANFAGSTVFFYRLNDDTSTTPASMLLHSPAVSIVANYERDRVYGKHIVKVEVLTTTSDNTLYATCVPVIEDFAEGIKRMMHRKKKPKKKDHFESGEQQQLGNQFGNLLEKIDIHFGLRIEKQSLTLSCAPTAKVAAIVGMEGINVQVNSGTGDIPSVFVTALFDSISASLQHVYSREISGRIAVSQSIIAASFEHLQGQPNIISSANLADVDGYVNMKQYQDLELFKDIWFPKQYAELYASFAEEEFPQEEGQSDLAANKNISARFREVSSSSALPCLSTIIVTNLKLQVDFGQSLGNFKLEVDRSWGVLQKTTNWAQDLKLGVDTIALSSEGRLSGNVNVSRVSINTNIQWTEGKEPDVILHVPLILITAAVDEFHVKTSFDYHVFAIANVESFSVDVYNRKSEVSVAKDHLFVTIQLDTAEFFITSLTASNFYDIWNTVSRMVEDNQRSYKETLWDSNKKVQTKAHETTASNILETVKKLEAKIQVISGRLMVHVYPSCFEDSKVLVLRIDGSSANFQQNEFPSGISNALEIKFNGLRVSLSMASVISEDFIAQCSVAEFANHARKARGGTIFVFPSFVISMKTFQKYDDNVIEYLYQSSFGGTVDIKWNLGSVNFIREMYSVHKKALQSRQKYKQGLHQEEVTRSSVLDDEDPTGHIGQVINETIENVAEKSKYRYEPLAEPIIEVPQLKELGNATPPLEWFGLHRTKFPNVTHEFAIVSLQKLMHEVESQYSKILGRA